MALRFRGPLAEQRIVVFELAPALAVADALCVVLAVATATPMRRILRLYVMRAINADYVN